MATLSVTGFDYALKTRYSPEVVKFMAYMDNPFFARIDKVEKFGGKNFVFACQYGTGGAGRSANFANAQTNTQGANGVDFTLTRVKDYGLARIDSETVMSSEGDEDALMSAVEDEQNKKMHALIRSIAIGMYGNGSGQLGTLTGTPGADPTLTLTNSDDITNFEVGQRLVFAANDTSALRDSGEVLTVNEIDLDAGTMEMSANLDTIAALASGDAIFTEGDYVSASDRLKISGLSAWIPATAPTATLFFGVDRSSDTARLGGHRMSGTGKSIEEALYDLAVRIGRDGGRPNLSYVSFENYGALATLLGSKVQYINHMVAEIAFEGIRINGPKGKIDVFPDQNCPNDVGYVLTENTWHLKSLGAAPQILDLDGQRWARISDADGIEIRNAFMGNMYCDAPGWNGRTTLT
jgi:hypothetical protein